jgi:hypothetical protein
LWRDPNKFLVEVGLARFIDEDDVTVTEPLALIVIMHYLESEGKTLHYNMLIRSQDNPGAAFEEAVLVALTKLLRNGIKLTTIFRFAHPIPPWAHCSAQIVTRNSSGDFVDFDIVTEQPVIPSAGVAFRAEEPEDVKAWLENGQTGWCLPGHSMGPDLLARIRLSTGKFILLAIQAKCNPGKRGALKTRTAVEAIESLCPEDWFSGTVCRYLLCDFSTDIVS